MWFWLIALIDFCVLGFLPHRLGLPYWIHFPVLAVYCLWVPPESETFRKWDAVNALFEVDQKGEPLPPDDQQVIYALHPHGVFAASVTAFFALTKERFHVKPVGSSILFLLPIIKEFVGLVGTVPANRKDILAALACGDSLAMCPGGIRELPGLDLDRVKRGDGFVQRPGFINIAKAEKVPVVPVWSPGEEDLYDVWLWYPRLQRWLLRNFLYPGIVFSWGRPGLRFWPKNKKLTLYFGKAIPPDELDQERFYNEMAKLRAQASSK